ncbi:MAG: hypothetical protein K2O29_09960 [Ruminococcus sp.]|nr:hypothetical protein [Ruminococcus sp.]MDE7138760.1 hypothetical protein [Ruminococcus sp.]
MSDANSSKIRTLYLWTESGALLHAKSLNTDKAWVVYEFLVDTYFRVQKIINSYSELVELVRNEINADIEETVSRVLDKKLKSFSKTLNKYSINVITESVSETTKSLVTYFDTLINVVQSLLKLK